MPDIKCIMSKISLVVDVRECALDIVAWPTPQGVGSQLEFRITHLMRNTMSTKKHVAQVKSFFTPYMELTLNLRGTKQEDRSKALNPLIRDTINLEKKYREELKAATKVDDGGVRFFYKQGESI